MFPAARKGDPVSHDMIVPAGVIGPPIAGPCAPPFSPVMVEFLPAAHVNCTVVCSGATVAGPLHPPPPIPPPIVIGSPTVLIHGLPAARWMSDTSACGAILGDVKLIATRTVWIGDFGLGAGPRGAVPPECAYLGKPFVVSAPQPDFDRIRGMYTLSPGTPGVYHFPGDGFFPTATVNYEVEVKGRKITVIMPSSGAPAGKYLPTAEQVAMSLATVPPAQLDSIKQVAVSPNRNPDDADWEKQYGIKNFTSAARGGPDGVDFFPQPRPISQADVDSDLIHEGGHAYSAGLWKDPAKEQAWKDAMKKDVRSPSNHPGQIKMVDLFHGTSKMVPVEDVPENRRFVYLKNGLETHDSNEATERVPVVEVRMLSLDERGNLAAPEIASKVRIDEFGPNDRPLRSTIMRREK